MGKYFNTMGQEMFPHLNNKNGFTLVEMLMVLGIVSILILLIPPINTESLKRQQDEQFLETFQFDVLYVQNMSNLIHNENVFIRIYKDSYKILKNNNETIAERPYPFGISINPGGYTDIRFKENGTMLYPRTILITTRHEVYKAVFQLGKGRFYFAKQ